jgi:hypothetical protein
MKAMVQAYRTALETAGLAVSSINVRLQRGSQAGGR